MSVSKQQGEDFLAKMKEKAAAKPAAPLNLKKPEPEPVAIAAKKKPSFAERTMSFKLAEADYDAVDEIIFKRKRAGEKQLTNKDAGREMVAHWLRKHGVEPFDYGDG